MEVLALDDQDHEKEDGIVSDGETMYVADHFDCMISSNPLQSEVSNGSLWRRPPNKEGVGDIAPEMR